VTISDYVAIGILILLALLALPRLLARSVSKQIDPTNEQKSQQPHPDCHFQSQQQREQTTVALETWHFPQKRARKVPEEEAGLCDGCHGAVTKSHIQWFSDFDFASCLAQNIRPK
jgi:hypothetical protein